MNQYLERVTPNMVVDALAQSQWSEKKLIWVADAKEGYLQASILKENGEELEVSLPDGSVTFIYIEKNC